MPDLIVPFVVVTALLTLTPGPDMALVLRNGIRGGSSVAWATGLGCCTGIAVYAAASAVGLAALLAASATVFEVVKLVGALYLVHLGVRSLLHARRLARAGSPASPTPGSAPPLALLGRGEAFRQGLLSNLLNPKIALIFLTLVPQFVSAGEQPLRTTTVLAATFLAMALVWWRCFSWAVGALGAFMSRVRVRVWIERVTGVALVGLGVRVALDH